MVILLILVHSLLLLQFSVGVLFWFCDIVFICDLVSFAITSLRKRESLLLYYYFVCVSVYLCSNASSSLCHELVCGCGISWSYANIQ